MQMFPFFWIDFSATIYRHLMAKWTYSLAILKKLPKALLAPHYMGMGVNTEALHRTVAISSGALDSLPHNRYVVTTIRGICGETHQEAYNAVGALTVIVPALGTILAIILFSFGLGI